MSLAAVNHMQGKFSDSPSCSRSQVLCISQFSLPRDSFFFWLLAQAAPGPGIIFEPNDIQGKTRKWSLLFVFVSKIKNPLTFLKRCSPKFLWSELCYTSILEPILMTEEEWSCICANQTYSCSNGPHQSLLRLMGAWTQKSTILLRRKRATMPDSWGSLPNL